MERRAVVAGAFYPAAADKLADMLDGMIDKSSPGEQCIAVVAPHAGYVYSGRVAGATYSKVVIPGRVLILAPNHTGAGRAVSLYPGEAWQTPLGRIQTDRELNRLLEESGSVEPDERAHAREHSAEVHLPFLQHLRPDVKISVAAIATHDYDVLRSLGLAAAAAIRMLAGGTLIVASSDMTHFEHQRVANAQDRLAIARIEALDPGGLLETVASRGISMCGAGPVAAALFAALDLGAREARLVAYETSGDVTGETDSVVGYAGLVIK